MPALLCLNFLYSITESREQALYNMHQKLADLRKQREKAKQGNTTDITKTVEEKKAVVSRLSKELEDLKIKREGMGIKCRILHKEEDCRAADTLSHKESELSKTFEEEEHKTNAFIESVQDILDSVQDIDEEIQTLENDLKDFNVTDTTKGAGHGPEVIYVGQQNIYPFEFSTFGRSEVIELPKWHISVSHDDVQAVKELTAFFGAISQQLNREIRDVSIKATLIRVDIKREWLKDSLLGEVRGLALQRDQVYTCLN